MFVYAAFYALALIVGAALTYAIYKILWFAVKMLALGRFMKDVDAPGVRVEKKRSLFDTVFGKKGEVDYLVQVGEKRYEVSILSVVSTHGRLNVEKTRSRYFVESRRADKVFYSRHVNSHLPSHVSEYKGETRVSRRELFLSPPDPSVDGQILLIYPYPKRVTYTDSAYREIYSGDKIEGHVVMNVNDFDRLINPS